MQQIRLIKHRLLALGLMLQATPCYSANGEPGEPVFWAAVVLLSTAAIIIGGGHYIYQLKNQIRNKETQLERSAAEWTYAMDFLEDPMYLVDLNDIVVRANRAFYNQCGKSEEEVLGQDVKTLLHFKPEVIPCPGCRARMERQDAFFTKEAGDPSNPTGKPIEVTIRVVRDDQGEPIGILQGIRDLSHLRHTEDALRESRKRLANAQRIAQIGSWDWDIKRDDISGSQEFYNLFEFDPEQNISLEQIIERIPISEQNDFKLALQEAIARNTAFRFDHSIALKNGQKLSIHQEAEISFDENGKAHTMSATAQNITLQKQAELALVEEKERVEVTLESIGDAVITVDLLGYIEYANQAALTLLGYSQEELISQYYDCIRIVDHETGAPLKDPIGRCLIKYGNIVEKNCRLFAKNGSQYNIDFTVAPILDENKGALGCVLILHDITQMHKLTRLLNYQATHDPLTGLVNRREFEVRLEQALESADVDNTFHSLVFIDLDNFKIVNDTCGHLAGDELLKQFSHIIKDGLRKTDTFARLGGDEFALLLSGCSQDKAEAIARDLLKDIRQFRFNWNGKTFEVGVSIGITTITDSSKTSTEVLSEADSACYLAKRAGKNRIQSYDQHNFRLLQHRGQMQWVQKITQALADNRFELYCQQILPLNQANTGGFFEFLLRLRNNDDSLILPAEFIPAAERFQLMPTIDRWVVEQAFKELSDEGLDIQTGSINLSAQSVCDKDFFQFVVDQKNRFKLDSTRICFEITETAAVDNMREATRLIQQLREMGFRFALDDFGSGMSSFAYLKQLNVDFLKIDGMFIKDICSNKVDLAMATSVHQIGQLMGLKTIAECAESQEIVNKLASIQIDYAQGIGIDSPKPIRELYRSKSLRSAGT